MIQESMNGNKTKIYETMHEYKPRNKKLSIDDHQFKPRQKNKLSNGGKNQYVTKMSMYGDVELLRKSIEQQ